MLTSKSKLICITGFSSRFFVDVAEKLTQIDAHVKLIFILLTPRISLNEPNTEAVLTVLTHRVLYM